MPITDVSGKTLEQLISLEGRAAVITGAAKGIGFAIARRFAEAGADILLADVDKASVEESAKALTTAFGARTKALITDVTREQDVIDAADTCMKEFGRLDIWVNNAGIYPDSLLLDLSVGDWDKVQSINLRGAFIGSREAARRMKDAPMNGGVIINIESVGAFRGHAGLAAYTASKHGMNGLAKCMAVELGPHNIRVVGLAPTGTWTPGVAARTAGASGEDVERAKALEKQILEKVPLGRFGMPDDIARAALFAASDMAMLITGSTIAVDAGGLAE